MTPEEIDRITKKLFLTAGPSLDDAFADKVMQKVTYGMDKKTPSFSRVFLFKVACFLLVLLMFFIYPSMADVMQVILEAFSKSLGFQVQMLNKILELYTSYLSHGFLIYPGICIVILVTLKIIGETFFSLKSAQ